MSAPSVRWFRSGIAADGWRSLGAGLVDLVAPVSCAGCGRTGASLCRRCRAALATELAGGVRRRLPDPCPAGLPPVMCGADYAGVVAALLSAYKDGDRRDLVGLLAAILARAALAALTGNSVGIPAGHGPRAGIPAAARDSAGAGILLVPTATSRSARRRRGDKPAAALAEQATALVAARIGPDRIVSLDALTTTRQVRDQSRLDHVARRANLTGAYAVRPRLRARLAGSEVILVDDVLTTGATLAEAARAVTAAGARVRAAATIAASVKRQG